MYVYVYVCMFTRNKIVSTILEFYPSKQVISISSILSTYVFSNGRFNLFFGFSFSVLFFIFSRMPVLYSELGIPAGRILSSLFFLCLSLAGVTSLVALLELPIHTLEEMRSRCSVVTNRGLKRHESA